MASKLPHVMVQLIAPGGISVSGPDHRPVPHTDCALARVPKAQTKTATTRNPAKNLFVTEATSNVLAVLIRFRLRSIVIQIRLRVCRRDTPRMNWVPPSATEAYKYTTTITLLSEPQRWHRSRPRLFRATIAVSRKRNRLKPPRVRIEINARR